MINSFTQEREAIEGRFKRLFDSSQTAIQFDNVSNLIKGDTTVKNTNQESQWVRLSVVTLDANQVEITNKRTRIFGSVVINIFVKSNTGSNRAREIVDQIFPIFNGVLFDGIQCQATAITNVPSNDGWFQMNLITNYYWDRCA